MYTYLYTWEMRGEPEPIAPLSNTLEQQNVGGEWRFQRNLFSVRTVWRRYLLNPGLSRSSRPLSCSPCASEMGGYLGMGWVSLLLSAWVENSTSQMLFFSSYSWPMSISILGYRMLRPVLKVLPSVLPCRRAISQDSWAQSSSFVFVLYQSMSLDRSFALTELSVRVFQSAIKSSWLLSAGSLFPQHMVWISNHACYLLCCHSASSTN